MSQSGNCSIILRLFVIALVIMLAAVTTALAQASGMGGSKGESPGAAPPGQGQDLGELGKQLDNPISSVWNISTQSNMYFYKGDLSPAYRGQFVFNFQPVLPIPLTKNWTLIPRPVIPIQSNPYIKGVNPATGSLEWSRTGGFGDIALVTVLSPNIPGVILGFGPTFLMNMTARELALPEDVILDLDGLCTRNYPLPLARACRALAEYFSGKSVTVSTNQERDAAFLGALKELNKVNASSDVGHASCSHIPAGTVGQVTVVVTREMEACFDRVEREREERRSELRREANFWHSQPPNITTYNQELLATARDYYAKACRGGDTSACTALP